MNTLISNLLYSCQLIIILLMENKLLLTGQPGTGKTTIIQKVIDGISNIGGFYTSEIVENGRRAGFSVKTLLNRDAEILAHINSDSNKRVGRYGVNIGAFEDIIKKEFEDITSKNINLIIIDEIGKMEMYSSYFCKMTEEFLKGDIPVLGVIQMRNYPFVDRIKRLDRIRILEINYRNRDIILKDIRNFLKKVLV